MQVLRFKCGIPEWLVPVDEHAADLKSMLRIQWREFIHEIGDVDKNSVFKVVTSTSGPEDRLMLLHLSLVNSINCVAI